MSNNCLLLRYLVGGGEGWLMIQNIRLNIQLTCHYVLAWTFMDDVSKIISPPFQGFLVAIIYCFCNGEVRTPNIFHFTEKTPVWYLRWLTNFSLLRCKLRSKNPGAEEPWPWTSKEKLGAAVTLTAMDLWCHTPVSPMSLPEHRWPSTSPPGWDRCLWTVTGTCPGTWRTALSPRTPYLRRDRSFTFLTRSIRLTHGPARTRNPHLWWRRRGRQSCDLQDRCALGEKLGGKKTKLWNSLRIVWRGWLHASTLPVFFSCELTQNTADWWGSKQKRVYHLRNLGRLHLGDDDPQSCGKYFHQPSATVNV